MKRLWALNSRRVYSRSNPPFTFKVFAFSVTVRMQMRERPDVTVRRSGYASTGS
jgi:hypothetical protein